MAASARPGIRQVLRPASHSHRAQRPAIFENQNTILLITLLIALACLGLFITGIALGNIYLLLSGLVLTGVIGYVFFLLLGAAGQKLGG